MILMVIIAVCVGFTLFVMGVNLNPISAIQTLLRQIKEQREEDLSRLGTFHKRLKTQTSELLARANDLDQQSKYQTVPEKWSFGIYLLCTQLVTLSEQVSMLESYLNKGNISAVRHQLFQSVNLGHRLSVQLNDLKRQLDGENAHTKSLTAQK